MCIPYTTLDSCTAFLEQRASNNFPDILRNFVRMRQQWFPGRFSYGLGTRLVSTPPRYGGRLVSKLHSDAFAKLEHVLLSFEYAFFIRVWSLHLGMLFAFEHALFIWVYMLFAFEHALFIWVCSLHLSVLFSFGYGLFILDMRVGKES